MFTKFFNIIFVSLEPGNVFPSFSLRHDLKSFTSTSLIINKHFSTNI